MPLYKKQTGEGDAIVFLSGWGFHHRIWDPVVETLSSRLSCWQIDLPGIGWSPAWASYDLDSVIDALAEALPPQFTLCGWSLGGLIATAFAAKYPGKITRLITVATNPKFIATVDWPGVDPEVMMRFYQRLQSAPAKTLREFVLLQCQGSEDARSWFKTLSALITDAPEPDPNALGFGLSLLQDLDLREPLKSLSMPKWHVLGRLDALVPQKIADLIPDSEVFMRSAHMPFLTEIEKFCEGITR
jgi:pimeloyl-[acyl-carrier protein] methyl ester esterase